MDEVVLLTALALFTLLAGLCSIVFNKIKLPPLIGYLMAGIIIVNFWHVSAEGQSVISILSDMGLIMLMFCIGMEINLKKIRKQGLFAIEVALVQLPLMVLGGMIAGSMLGFNSVQSLCLGAIISGSSTAVVMAVLKSQNRLDREHIDTLVLITIMEDIGQVIILSMITPILAGTELDTGALIAMIISIVVFMAVSILIGLKLMPRLINWISDNVTSEVVVICAVGLAFGMALLASHVHLSVAIGAFLMGMMIAGSRKSKEINHDIEPMKNIFMAMFFISVGMKISLDTLVSNVGLILIIFILFVALKTATVFLGYWIGNENARLGFISAVSLAAMGEFAFIIAKEALDYSVIDANFYTSVVGAALVSMIALPFLTKYSTSLWDKGAEKCPERLMSSFRGINRRRDAVYGWLSETTKKSRKDFSARMARSYFQFIIILLIEVTFYMVTSPVVEWLVAQFGSQPVVWNALMLLINFILIFLPTYKLIGNIKFVDRAIIDSKWKRRERGMDVLNDRFLRTSTLILAVFIDIIILMIVPNNLGVWEHIAVFAVALVILLIWNRRRLKKEEEVSRYVEDDDFGTADMEEFMKLVAERYVPNESADADAEVAVKKEEGAPLQ